MNTKRQLGFVDVGLYGLDKDEISNPSPNSIYLKYNIDLIQHISICRSYINPCMDSSTRRVSLSSLTILDIKENLLD